MWYDFLSGYKPSFRRQFVIMSYIADFYCPVARLVVELDGSQHYQTEEMKKDKLRGNKMESLGIKTIRYTNAEIQQRFREVCLDIDRNVKERIDSLKQE